MIKVFLVEDEYIIREAIKRTVNWTAQGYELVGEAGDGEKAYPMILDKKPDILITDIRMPFMDGLELSRLIRDRLPKTRIVILSGYDDFSYAQDAIAIGVTQYLLKPVSGAQLLETLGKVSDEIRTERDQVDYKEIYEAEHAERLKDERQRFYHDLIDGRMSMAQSCDRAQSLGIRLETGGFCILLLQLSAKADSYPSSGQETQLVSEALDAIKDEADRTGHIGYYEQLGGMMCILVMASDLQTLRSRVQEIVGSIRALTLDQPEMLMFLSVGPSVERISEIAHSFKEASRRFAGRFKYDASRIFTEQDDRETLSGADSAQSSDAAFSLSGFDISRIDKPIIVHFLRSGTPDDVNTFVEECFSRMSINSIRSQMVRQYIAMDTYLTVASYLQELGLTNEQIEEGLGRFDDSAVAASSQDISRFLTHLFAAALQQRDLLAENRYGSLVAQAKQLIYRDYASGELSLSSVAEQIGVSANHLSRLFSQTMEMTFIEFLTSVRMEKAKSLLQTTTLPSSEIGPQVGYADPHYFYYLFKKTQGQTPKEYRQSSGGV